jgi:radical SAM/Cys-rich protein
MKAVDALVDAEVLAGQARENVAVVLNGDMHWFDKTAENFEIIENAAAPYTPLVGNVEAELRRQTDVGVGCGCAYPPCTADDAVSRSNRIHKMLSRAMEARPDLKARLAGRPATLTVDVAGVKVGITHGDEKLIGGWDCSRESLQDILRQDELDRFMQVSGIDVFATTHTCAPAALALAHGVCINNGAAGLPNFAGQHFGLAIRVAATPHPDALFGCQWKGAWVQAVPVRYDHAAFLQWFDALWAPASPAAISYRARIVSGPADHIPDSLLGGFEAYGAPDAQGQTGAPATLHATDEDVELALARLLYFEDMLPEKYHVTSQNPTTLQVNITAQCNLACAHCHVRSNPKRTEAMSRETLEAVLEVARAHNFETIDITGGAPELHPNFEWFIEQAAAAVPHVIVRTNLVILQQPRFAHLPKMYAQLGINVVASVPNVFAAQADQQRGAHTHDASIAALRTLNALGYGQNGEGVTGEFDAAAGGEGVTGGLQLDLVFNPQEPVLPPEQGALEEMYRRRLADLGIQFNNLFAVANNPIGRYGASLIDSGAFDNYTETLIDSFNPQCAPALMCRHQISVGWDGAIYDCDFNQALVLKAEFPVTPSEPNAATNAHVTAPANISDFAADPTKSFARTIIFGNHCYACTAGAGSSCTGTLVLE